jgi:FecR protein
MKFVVWKSSLGLLCALLCALLTAAPTWAAAFATATIADGEVQLVRGATRHALTEGVRLAKDDIVETTAKARFVRIEFADGVILDLGPESRALIAPKFSGERAKQVSRFHLLRGTAKLTVPKPLTPAAGSFTIANTDITGVARSAVFAAQAQELQVFAESGEVNLQERRAGKVVAKATVKNSEFYSRAADGKASTTPRPTGAFIQKLPRAFMDSLPSRAAAFASRDVAPKPLGEISYAEAEPWLDAEGLRAYFVTRWRPLAQNAAFREGLAANMANHPEWDRILFPEKYLPKPAVSAAAGNAPAPVYKKP